MSISPATYLLEFVKVHMQAIECQQFIGGEGRNRTGLGDFRHFLSPSAMSSPPEACSLKAIEHPYTQAFPPFCQAPLLHTNRPSNTQQLLSQNSFTGTFTGCDMRLLEKLFVMDTS